MIYFIKAGEHIKIGYSRDNISFKSRLKSFNTSTPYELEIINIIDGDTKYESNIFNYFIKYHCKGEWFYYNQEIIDFALNPLIIPERNLLRPSNNNYKIIIDNFENIIKLYLEGFTLQYISELYKIPRKRLSKHIPEDIKLIKNKNLIIKKQINSVNNKPVICLNTNIKYLSAKDAERKLNVNKVSEVCNGNRNHTHGLIFKYLENDE